MTDVMMTAVALSRAVKGRILLLRDTLSRTISCLNGSHGPIVPPALKAFYFEAAAEQPATRPPSAGELSHWLFRETVLGGVLYDAREALLSAEDAQLQLIGRFLVPAVFGRRA